MPGSIGNPRSHQRNTHGRCHGCSSAYSPHSGTPVCREHIHYVYHMDVQRIAEYQYSISKKIDYKAVCQHTDNTAHHKKGYVYEQHHFSSHYVRIGSHKRREHSDEIKWQHHPAHIRHSFIRNHSAGIYKKCCNRQRLRPPEYLCAVGIYELD